LTTATALAVDGSPVPRIVVADGANHRVVSLQADGVDLALLQQYIDLRRLDTARGVAFSSDSHTLYVLTDASLIAIPLP
jgi:hypothetical protein